MCRRLAGGGVGRSFDKVDVSCLDNPPDFLRVLGDIYAMFDLAVHTQNMYKVHSQWVTVR